MTRGLLAQNQRGDELFQHPLRVAQRLVDAGQVEPAKRMLEAFPPQMREWEWYVVWQKAIRAPRPSVTCEFGPFHVIACSPDGHRIAATGQLFGFRSIFVWNDFSGSPLVYSGGRPGPYITSMCWHPDGKQIQALDSYGPYLSTRDDGGIKQVGMQQSLFRNRLSTLNPCGAHGLCWTVASLQDDVVSIRIGQQISSSFDVPGGEITALAYCPAKGLVATGSLGGTVTLWDAATGESVELPETHGASVTALAFNASGTRLVSGGKDGSLRCWDPDSGRQILRFTGPQLGPDALAFQPDGHGLVVASDQDIELWGGEPK
jgi:WD40 repeat protein